MKAFDFAALTTEQRDFICNAHVGLVGNGATIHEAVRMYRLVSRLTDAQQAMIAVARLGLKISLEDPFVVRLSEEMCNRGYIVPDGEIFDLTSMGRSADKLLEACQLVNHIGERTASGTS